VLQFIKHVVDEYHFFYWELNFMVIINLIIYFVKLFIIELVKRYQYQFKFNLEQPVLNLQTFTLEIRNLKFSRFNLFLGIYLIQRSMDLLLFFLLLLLLDLFKINMFKTMLDILCNII